MHEWSDISKKALSLALHETLIKYSFFFSWRRMLLNIEVRSYEHTRIDYLLSYSIISMFLGILISIISDTCFGKYNTVFFGLLIGIVQPLFCSVSFLPGNITRPEDYWLLSNTHLNLMELATVVCNMNEGVRLALVFEQMTLPKKQFSIRIFVMTLLLARKFGHLLLNLSMTYIFYQPDFYCLFSVIAISCYGIYLNRIVSDRKLLKEEQLVKGFVWSTLVCTTTAVGKRVKNVFSAQNIPLYSNDRYHYMVILGAKKIMDLGVIGFTVTALSISSHILYQYILLYTRLLVKNEFDQIVNIALGSLYDIFSLLALVFLEMILIPKLVRKNICNSNLQCLKATFVILGAALLSILVLDCCNNYMYGIHPLAGGSEVRIYNGAENSVIIKHDGRNRTIRPTELFAFKTSFTNRKTNVKITLEGVKQEYCFTSPLYEAETYVVTEKKFKKIKTADPIFKAPPSYNTRPHVNCMVVSNRDSIAGNLTVNDQIVQINGDEGFVSTVVGNVNIAINGSTIYQQPTIFAIGFTYLIFLYHENGTLVNTTVDALDRHLETSVFWIFLPFILTIFGQCLGEVSTFCLLYNDSPPNVRAIVFSYFVMCSDFGVIIQILNNNTIVKMTSINIALTLCNHVLFFVILCAISRNYQFRLAHHL